MGETSLTVAARLDAINSICEAVADEAKNAGFDDRTAYACELAVYEACENIVVHGYGEEDGEGEISAAIRSRPGELTVELRDQAGPFDPASAPANRPDPKEDLPIGGLGLYIVHEVMDEIRYERSRGENRLLLRKTKDQPQG